MISKALDKVVLAERQAAEKVDSAKQSSDRIIAAAHEKANEIIEKANQDIKIENESLIRKNKILIDEIFENNKKTADNDAFEIKSRAGAKKEKAVNMVITKIISN